MAQDGASIGDSPSESTQDVTAPQDTDRRRWLALS